jgi:hypothetical protein
MRLSDQPADTNPTSYNMLTEAVNGTGLILRGAFHPRPSDEVPELLGGRHAQTLVLLGFAGTTNWFFFSRAPEANDGQQHPLDRWSRRVIGQLAKSVGAVDVYPFPTDKPPYLPFQRWALSAGSVHQSPIKLLIHPDWGLWHSYRGALLFEERLDLPKRDQRPSPCDACTEKPCLSACPVGAFDGESYAIKSCVQHLGSRDGVDCMELGCRARRGCPVGAEHRYAPMQVSLHMNAFYSRHAPGIGMPIEYQEQQANMSGD